MDGQQDYGFEVFEEEFDLLADDAFNPTATPKTVYTPAEGDDTTDSQITPAFDAGDIDLLEDGEQKEEKPKETEDVAETEETLEDSIVEENTDDVFQKVADNLVEMGLLIPDENEEKVTITKPEELAEKFQKSFQTQANAHISNVVGQYGPEYSDAWQKIFVDGLNPYDYFTRQAKIDSIEGLDIENEEHQKQIVRTYLQKQGLPPERIETKIQQATDLDDLANDAKVYQGLLVQAEQKALADEVVKTKKEREQAEAVHTSFASAVHNILTEKVKEKEYDGIPVTQKDLERAVDFVYTYKYQGADGKLLTEADVWYLNLKQNPALAAKLALLAPNNLDTTKIQKKSQSKQNDKLFNNLVQTNKVDKRTKPSTTQSGNFFDD